ncbi:MAG: DUF2326 domain-containing protein [Tissierellales bacterium]|jgi:uncharacterized protein YydD (DUF2326 family)|nr:DUF2326 domain-containing protein [Tissierellales bacterium]
MLKKIRCDKFLQKDVIFHKGLNSIIGDDIASNSIGKSTMLMIIDFVFGGNEYINKNHDAIDQLGHHDFKFTFEFDEEISYFIRSTSEYKYVSFCDEKFEVLDSIKVEDYTNWLQKKYSCELEGLSFRSIIGRYFRVYGKENLNERKPIQYFEKESASKSITALLKLFDKYDVLKDYEIQIKKLEDEKSTLVEAAKKDLIPHAITRTLYGKNEKKITELSNQLEVLKKDILTATTNIEALISKEILKLRKDKSDLVTNKNKLNSRLVRTQNNLKNKKINFKSELEHFVEYFPNFNVEQINKLDDFHQTITKNLSSELKKVEKELKKQIVDIESHIDSINKEIEEKLTVKNAPKFAVEKVVDLVAQIKQLNDENSYYTKKKGLEESIKTSKDDLNLLKEKVLDEMCSEINVKMYELNKEIYPDGRRAPTINIHGNRYTFNTYGDTGTGTAFANLISFDLALLDLTCLPAIAHDLPLLKNIENSALENIIEIYSHRNKQIFIAIDKLNSYDKNAAQIIEEHKALQLSKDKVLFIKNWKKQDK